MGARIAPPFMEATDASRLVCDVVVSYQEFSLSLSQQGPKTGERPAYAFPGAIFWHNYPHMIQEMHNGVQYFDLNHCNTYTNSVLRCSAARRRAFPGCSTLMQASSKRGTRRCTST